MRVGSILVHGFRNLLSEEVVLHPRLTVLSGENGQGKTNFLEALYFLAALRSFRTARASECIAWGADVARIAGVVSRREREITIEVRLGGAARRVLVDGKPLRSARDYRGDLNAVLFTPEDLGLAKGGPDRRRRFLDRAVYSSAPAHLGDLLDYDRALRARNALLKEGTAQGPLAEAHLLTLARHGAAVIARRSRWIAAVRPLFERVFAEIAAAPAAPGIAYESIAGVSEEMPAEKMETALLSAWHSSLPQDIARGFTTRGPHADDLALSLGERPLRIAGSQGQQRAFVLALKLAEIRHAEEVLGDSPVLLLDDVGSELDVVRRGHLFAHLDATAGQVVVTTTDASLVSLTTERIVYGVSNGALRVVA
jgi:DNA replication and repair protein RecF